MSFASGRMPGINFASMISPEALKKRADAKKKKIAAANALYAREVKPTVDPFAIAQAQTATQVPPLPLPQPAPMPEVAAPKANFSFIDALRKRKRPTGGTLG